MSYGGISRGPQTEEQKAACDQFERDYSVGYDIFGLMRVKCRECGQSDIFPDYVEHTDECETGKRNEHP